MRLRGLLASLLMVGLLGVACARTHTSPVAASRCRDGCAAMTCPDGMVCTIGDRCAPRCQPLPISRH